MNLSKFDLQFKERTRFRIFFLMIPIFHDSGYRVNSLNNQRLAKRSTILQQIYILRNEAYIYLLWESLHLKDQGRVSLLFHHCTFRKRLCSVEFHFLQKNLLCGEEISQKNKIHCLLEVAMSREYFLLLN